MLRNSYPSEKNEHAVFKALGDATRREIISLLRTGPQAAGSIASHFARSRPGISRHLRVLRDARVVSETRSGRERLYQLNPASLKCVDTWIAAYRNYWDLQLRNVKRFAEAQGELMTDQIELEIEIAAIPQVVFAAWTQENHMLAWWRNPDEFETVGFESDLRVGGKWRAQFRGKAGQSFAAGGEYVRVDPPQGLSFTWKPDWSSEPPTTVHLDFLPTATGTLLRLKQQGFSTEAGRSQDMAAWGPTLDWLRCYLEKEPH
jgi:uncharacterized protein YndB with AHSA1/START domain